jgi:hypothetical protein
MLVIWIISMKKEKNFYIFIKLIQKATHINIYTSWSIFSTHNMNLKKKYSYTRTLQKTARLSSYA